MRHVTLGALLCLCLIMISCHGRKAASENKYDPYLVDARTIMEEFRKSYRRLFALTREPDFSLQGRAGLADEVLRQGDLSRQFRALNPPADYEKGHRKVEDALDTFEQSEALLLQALNERDTAKFEQAGRLASEGERSVEEAGNRLARPR